MNMKRIILSLALLSNAKEASKVDKIKQSTAISKISKIKKFVKVHPKTTAAVIIAVLAAGGFGLYKWNAISVKPVESVNTPETNTTYTSDTALDDTQATDVATNPTALPAAGLKRVITQPQAATETKVNQNSASQLTTTQDADSTTQREDIANIANPQVTIAAARPVLDAVDQATIQTIHDHMREFYKNTPYISSSITKYIPHLTEKEINLFLKNSLDSNLLIKIFKVIKTDKVKAQFMKVLSKEDKTSVIEKQVAQVLFRSSIADIMVARLSILINNPEQIKKDNTSFDDINRMLTIWIKFNDNLMTLLNAIQQSDNSELSAEDIETFAVGLLIDESMILQKR